MASELERIIRRYRRLVAQRDAAVTRRMVSEWQDIAATIQRDLQAISDKIYQAEAAGKIAALGPEGEFTFSRAWLMQRDRLLLLADQAERQAEKAIGAIIGEAVDAQAEAARLGILMGQDQLDALVGDFARLNAGAIESFVAAASTGSPLAELFARLPGTLGSDFRNEISRAIALGLNPREVARRIRKDVGLNLYRANLIARTEMLRSFRQGTLRTYEENPDIVAEVVWVCALDRRACAACWALHGRRWKVRGIDKPANDHPNGRCTLAPVVEGVDLGLPNRDQRFAELSEQDQRRVLGRTGHRRWKQGQPLDDFATIHPNPRWGSAPRVTRLRDLPDVKPPVRVVSPAPPVAVTRTPAPWRSAPNQRARVGELQRLTREIHEELERILPGDLTSRWSGRVHIKPVKSWNGIKTWECEIGLSRDTWNRLARRSSTTIHESLHAFSPGAGNPYDYLKYRGLEEGVIEKFTRVLRPEIHKRLGIDIDEALIAETRDAHSAYNRYIDALERARERSGLGEREFYERVYRTPLTEREDLIRELMGNPSPAEFEPFLRAWRS